MALLAVFAIAPAVHIFGAVTIDTSRTGLLITLGYVTQIAGHRSMLADEWKIGSGVIELGLGPRGIHVTGVALFPQSSLVDVVIRVAFGAGRRSFPMRLSFVVTLGAV